MKRKCVICGVVQKAGMCCGEPTVPMPVSMPERIFRQILLNQIYIMKWLPGVPLSGISNTKELLAELKELQ